MTTDRKKPGVALWATVGLVALLPVILYAGAYLYTATPIVYATSPPPWDILPHYSLGGRRSTLPSWWEAAFLPAHWLDRKIRSDVWAPYDPHYAP